MMKSLKKLFQTSIPFLMWMMDHVWLQTWIGLWRALSPLNMSDYEHALEPVFCFFMFVFSVDILFVYITLNNIFFLVQFSKKIFSLFAQ